MIAIKIISDCPDWKMLRQTPGAQGRWRNCFFYEDDRIKECDWLVVYSHVLKEEHVQCPAKNTIYVDPEPPTIRLRGERFLKQFSYVVTCRRDLKLRGTINTQQGLLWHVGMQMESSGRHRDLDFTFSSSVGITRGYDEFNNHEAPRKTKLLSVMSSDKAFTDGHRRRRAFIEVLKNRFGDSVEIYGRGIKDISDKWDAIADYKYHVAIENSAHPDYWTEKLSDSYLAGAYPFYYGCPNLSDYLPSSSFTRIDINDPQRAVEIIAEGIGANLYENSLESLKEAKELILNKHNIFAVLSDLIEAKANQSRHSPKHKSEIVVRPDGYIPPHRLLIKRLLGKTVVGVIHKFKYGRA